MDSKSKFGRPWSIDDGVRSTRRGAHFGRVGRVVKLYPNNQVPDMAVDVKFKDGKTECFYGDQLEGCQK